MESNNKNLYALILGVSSGFGAASAKALAKDGYHIIGLHLDRNATLPAVEAVRSAIEGFGVKALFYNVNAADAQKREEIITAIKAEFEGKENARVRVMLHSLAFGTLMPFISDDPKNSISQKQIEMTQDVMANTFVYWTQALIYNDLMREDSRIFALTSSGSQRVIPMYGAVSSAKAALESYVRQLAMELAPRGITVNAIKAGITDTPALRKIPGTPLIIGHAKMRNPIHRLTVPEDVAHIISLLSRKESYWLNGETISVDGGENVVDLTWWQAPKELEE